GGLAPVLRRRSVPAARASNAVTASRAAVSSTIRTPTWLVSDQTGQTGGFQLRACSFRTANGKATAEPASPAANVAEPITMALAASTRPRRGLAARLVRIMPRRYSPRSEERRVGEEVR